MKRCRGEICKIGCSPEYPETLFLVIHSAEDISDRNPHFPVFLIHVGIGPDRTFRIVEHLGGDGAQQKPAKLSISTSGHHDEIDVSLSGDPDDLFRWISHSANGVYSIARKCLVRVLLEKSHTARQTLSPLAGGDKESSARWVVSARILYDIEHRELCPSLLDQILYKWRRMAASAGIVEREKDVLVRHPLVLTQCNSNPRAHLGAYLSAGNTVAALGSVQKAMRFILKCPPNWVIWRTEGCEPTQSGEVLLSLGQREQSYGSRRCRSFANKKYRASAQYGTRRANQFTAPAALLSGWSADYDYFSSRLLAETVVVTVARFSGIGTFDE